MRLALVGALSLFGLSSIAHAQSGPYLATVTASGAKLRAGASANYPETATLQSGDRLLVDHEDHNGWLAVQDYPGKVYSLSYVQIQFVENFDSNKQLPQNVVVTDDTTLVPGQIGNAQPMTTYRLSKVPAGTIVTVVGSKVTTTVDGKTMSWYPVIPPAGDFRYIDKKSVRADSAASISFNVSDNSSASLPNALPPAYSGSSGNNIPSQSIPARPVGSGAAAIPTSLPPSPKVPAKPVVDNPLWAQAEQAEKDGRLDDAEKLYFQLARTMNEPGGDHDIANLCYTQIHSLREKKRAGLSGSAANATRSTLVSTTTPTAGGAIAPPQVSTQASGAVGANARPDFAASGKLSRSALDIDGRRTYAVVGASGETSAYVVAGPGVDMDRYLNKKVDVYGSSTSRKDLSKPLIVATSAETIQ